VGDEVRGTGPVRRGRAAAPGERSRRAALAALALAVAALPAACGGSGPGGGSGSAAASDTATAADTAATPVRADTAYVADLAEVVQAPGQTTALREARVRAPFAGRLLDLDVADGDPVRAGDTLGAVAALESEASLDGARAMLADAATRQDSADARRALELARGALVRRPLVARTSGVVLSHAATGGDLVDQGETIVTIADRSAISFVARLTQPDVPKVAPGQRVRIELSAVPGPLTGTVRDVLPAASSETLSAPVRIDFASGRPPVATGLFGQATIVVGVRRHVTAVPAAAVLRDDVYGTTRVATVSDGRAVWVQVRTGLERGDTVQIVSPKLAPGTRVIVSGQVGLPDGTRVRIQP